MATAVLMRAGGTRLTAMTCMVGISMPNPKPTNMALSTNIQPDSSAAEQDQAEGKQHQDRVHDRVVTAGVLHPPQGQAPGIPHATVEAAPSSGRNVHTDVPARVAGRIQALAAV